MSSRDEARAPPRATLPASTATSRELTVEEARDRYLASNGFSTEAYSADTFCVRVFGRRWTLRNYAARKRVIALHDLHHVATGYGTDLRGEAEQSAWELRAGINSWFLWWFKLSAVAIGLVLCPRRVVRAYSRARGNRTLYVQDVAYASLLGRSVTELREELLGIPADGWASADRVEPSP